MRLNWTNLSEERKGEALIALEALLWSLFPIITSISLNTLTPLNSLAWSTLAAAGFFGILLTAKKQWREILNTSALKDIFWITLFIGVCYYGFYFAGLQRTTPGNASLLALTEIFFTFLFFNIWKKESISKKHILGAVCIVAGALLVLYPNFHKFNVGDILIVIAMTFAPGDHFKLSQKKLKSDRKLSAILALRMIMPCSLLRIGEIIAMLSP